MSTASSPPGLYAAGSLLNGGRYRVVRRLNKGATAVVYAAEDLLSGCRPVALKVVQCGSNKVPLNVVRREVSLSSSVAHENMVQLLDVFAEGTELIIVWELISGGDLLELLNECNGCMTEPAAAFYYVQLLRGVLHMHAVGYCHRDIKPENCMIEASSQRLKLIDFGLSKHLESVATLGVGTPDYMPPEMVNSQIKQQQRGQPQGHISNNQQQPQQQQPGLPPYDAKAVDAWAMGVLLYLLVSGCYPYEDPAQPNNLAATLLNVQAGRCQPLPEGISAGCRAVIAGLLCPDPSKRTRLEDLAHNPWLLQSAAAHAACLTAGLGPLAAAVEATPAWILPAVHHTAPVAAAAAPVASPHQHNTSSSSSHGLQGYVSQGAASAFSPATPLVTSAPPATAFGAGAPGPVSHHHVTAGFQGGSSSSTGAWAAAQQHASNQPYAMHQQQHQQQHQQYNYNTAAGPFASSLQPSHHHQQPQLHVGQPAAFADDQMDLDAAGPLPGAAAGVAAPFPAGLLQQHQQQDGVPADTTVYVRVDQGGAGSRAYQQQPEGDSKERRTGGLNWLHSLVRKRP